MKFLYFFDDVLIFSDLVGQACHRLWELEENLALNLRRKNSTWENVDDHGGKNDVNDENAKDENVYDENA